MFKRTFILGFIIFITNINAQSKIEQDIIGQWKPKNVYDMGAIIQKKHIQKIEMLQKMLLNSKFIFKSDHSFVFESSFKEMNIKNGYWKVLKFNNKIVISELKNTKSIMMEIDVLQKEGKTIFMLEEMFFAYEMEKIANN